MALKESGIGYLPQEGGIGNYILGSVIWPWQGGPKVVNLRDMMHILLPNLLNIAHALERCRLCTGFHKDKPLASEEYPRFVADLCLIENVAKGFSLLATQAKAARIIDSKDVPTKGDYYREVVELQSRFDDETGGIIFLYLPQNKQHYFLEEKPLFGEKVQDAFPAASYDIQEAGKCYALERWTATVLHLMRVMEIGLAAMCKALSVPDHEESWNKILDQLQKKLKDIEALPVAQKPRNWKKDRQFYNEAFVEFRHLKDAWRNYAMHARSTYDEERAANVLAHVGSFMRHLATRLKLKK